MKAIVFLSPLLASVFALPTAHAASTPTMKMVLTRVETATPPKAANDVTIKNFNFGPDITVAPGTTVTWHNGDGEPHTVVSTQGLFRSAAIDTDETFSFKFDKPGVYKYVCTIHPRMSATVTVK